LIAFILKYNLKGKTMKRYVYIAFSTKASGYWVFANKGSSICNLWDFLLDVRDDDTEQFIEWAKTTENDGGGTNISYLLGDKHNIYIGFDLNHLTEEQDLELKDDPKYFFKTTRLYFIDLLQQWKAVYQQHPHGIAVKELEDGSWKVEALTVQDVTKCKAAVDPKTEELPSDFAL
jgi:hypothetical protein